MHVASPDRAPLLIGGAILAGSALIALTIAFTDRWTIVPASPIAGVHRIDNWSGEVVLCLRPLGNDHSRLDCTAK